MRKLVSDIKRIAWVKVFENRVLRKILGPKRDEIIGYWRKRYNDALHNLYSSPD
jgi:hypothetical protein